MAVQYAPKRLLRGAEEGEEVEPTGPDILGILAANAARDAERADIALEQARLNLEQDRARGTAPSEATPRTSGLYVLDEKDLIEAGFTPITKNRWSRPGPNGTTLVAIGSDTPKGLLFRVDEVQPTRLQSGVPKLSQLTTAIDAISRATGRGGVAPPAVTSTGDIAVDPAVARTGSVGMLPDFQVMPDGRLIIGGASFKPEVYTDQMNRGPYSMGGNAPANTSRAGPTGLPFDIGAILNASGITPLANPLDNLRLAMGAMAQREVMRQMFPSDTPSETQTRIASVSPTAGEGRAAAENILSLDTSAHGKVVESGGGPEAFMQMIMQMLSGGGGEEAAPEGTAMGPTMLRVGERQQGDPEFESDEYLLAPPGTVVAPRTKGEEPTPENAAAAIMRQMMKSRKRKGSKRGMPHAEAGFLVGGTGGGLMGDPFSGLGAFSGLTGEGGFARGAGRLEGFEGPIADAGSQNAVFGNQGLPKSEFDQFFDNLVGLIGSGKPVSNEAEGLAAVAAALRGGGLGGAAQPRISFPDAPAGPDTEIGSLFAIRQGRLPSFYRSIT